MDDKIEGGWDAGCGVVCDAIHDGATNVAENIVHPESTCWVDVRDLLDEFEVTAGPLVYSNEDVVGDGGTGTVLVDVAIHPIIGPLAVFDETWGFVWFIGTILKGGFRFLLTNI